MPLPITIHVLSVSDCHYIAYDVSRPAHGAISYDSASAAVELIQRTLRRTHRPITIRAIREVAGFLKAGDSIQWLSGGGVK